MTDWSPACTSGAGEDDSPDSLLPIELASMFASPSHAAISSHFPFSDPFSDPMRVSGEWECVDLSEYVVSGWDPPNASELAEFEVQMEELVPNSRDSASSGAGMDDPEWVRSCLELPGYASSWVPVSSPSHSTMLYTMMQVDMSSEDQVVHGRASTEQT